MKFPKVLKLKTGAHDRVPFDLSSRTITTGEFYQFCPVKMIECVPGDKFDIDMSVFTRTAPLSVPSFDRAVVQTRAFFVPSRLCYPYWNEFITGEAISIGNSAITPSVPTLDSKAIVQYLFQGHFNDHVLSYQVFAPTDPEEVFKYDFKWYDGTTTQYRDLTAYGRAIVKILQGLGYRWNWQGPNDIADISNDMTMYYSAMPLFAFLRVYVDWFVPSQLQAAHPINALYNEYKTGTSNLLTWQKLESIFRSVCPAYDEDYFTAAWLYPNEVGGDESRIAPPQMNDFGLLNVGNNVSNTNQSKADTFLKQGNSSNLTSMGLRLLEGMANYITRNNFAGSRAVEQILARFGVRVPDTRLNRSEFLGADDTDIQFAEVTSTADSGDYKVGEFAGKGVAYGDKGKFSVECKEYGYIIIVSTIVPKISYVQGFDRNVIHLERFDFFTPEFDCVGMQAIASGELYCEGNDSDSLSYTSQIQGNCKPKDIFGYCPRYSEYKVSHDLLLGDFNLPSMNDGGALNGYHFSRMIHPDASTPVRAQGQFLFANGEQYNRIFNVMDSDLADHFYMWYQFKIKALRPMRSIADSIPLDGDGEKVAQQPNGVHLS